MRRRTVALEECAAAVLGSVLVRVPQSFFDSLRAEDRASVWTRLYDWLVLEHQQKPEDLHCRTRAGKQLMVRLLDAERRRLAHGKGGFRGKELREALSWSNLNSGPMETAPDGGKLDGDGCVVCPLACYRCGSAIESGRECRGGCSRLPNREPAPA